MAVKRSRAAYESDLQAQQSPFALYGTPLPPLDPEIRDDGSYVPVWKQEVRDEQGRKRLHGAFTGGFSAGYYNTVGSKEGWAPSTFVSSRSNRRKDQKDAAQRRPEDFMDEEDLADAEDARRVQMSADFAGLGSTEEDAAARQGPMLDLLRPVGETVGVKLLKRMGWREGQGIGPKVRRKARLGGPVRAGIEGGEGETTHLFAPEDTPMVSVVQKNDRKGLGFEGGSKLSLPIADKSRSDEEEAGQFGTKSSVRSQKPKKNTRKGGIGIGILNDTGSDDEDPYQIGPRISYNKVIGGDKKKKKLGAPNPLLRVKPVFISKKVTSAKGFRRCHDGRSPLDGFVLSSDPDTLSSLISSNGKYLPPKIPEGWKSKQSDAKPSSTNYQSTAEAAKASKLDPKSRASMLGETPLQGKSVFDYLSSSAREKLVTVTGNKNLPAALGEIPEGFASSPEEKRRQLLGRIPRVDRDVAIAALGRSASGWMPYAEDESKRTRYRMYLEGQAGMRDVDFLFEQPGQSSSSSSSREREQDAEQLKELHEFVHCAMIFKPMTGMMATRFTSSSAAPKLASDAPDSPSSSAAASVPGRSTPKPEDPAEAAAMVGMFGPLTRSSRDFFPSRLLCKRFNVKPPAHVQLDPDRSGGDGGDEGGPRFQDRDAAGQARAPDLVSRAAIEDMLRDSATARQQWNARASELGGEGIPTPAAAAAQHERIVIDAGKNDALEGERAGEAVFKAIFGDDDEDEDE